MESIGDLTQRRGDAEITQRKLHRDEFRGFFALPLRISASPRLRVKNNFAKG